MTKMYDLPALNALRNRLEMGPDEPAASFASRLAVRNGVDSAQTLCQQILFKLDGVRLGDEKAIGVLGILAGIPSEEILRRTFRQQPGGTIAIGDVAVPRSFVAKYSERICPACLREDAGGSGGLTTGMRDRTWWHLSFLQHCPDHELELVSFPHNPFTPERRDWQIDVGQNADQVLAGTLDRPASVPTLLEAHIVSRLRGKTPPEGWPGILPIHVVGRSSQMIGAVLQHGANVRERELDAHKRRHAAAAGFKVLMNGPDGFRDILDGLRLVSGPDVVFHASCYGALMQWFRTGAGSEDGYRPLRDILRDHIVNGWPLEAGTVVLDMTLPDRLWHTVASAEDEYGVSREGIREVLASENIIPPDATADDVHRLLFSATVIDRLIAPLRRGIISTAVQRLANIPDKQLISMTSAGFLVPLKGGHRDPVRYDEDEVLSFAANLEAQASGEIAPDDPHYLDIPGTVRKLRSNAPRIVRLILAGTLPGTRIAQGQRGYMAMRLGTDEVATHLRHIEDIKWPGLGATGRQLRIGGDATLALIQHGYLSAKDEAQDDASVTVTVVDPATIADFSKTYVSLHALAHEMKMDVSEVREALVGKAINSIADITVMRSWIFRRSECRVLLE